MAERIIDVTKESFEAEVLKSKTPVVVDFWAPWCGPCRMVSPIIEELAQEYGDRIKVCKINIDEEEALAVQYRVMSIPTICVFQDGAVQERMIGARPKEDFAAMIEKAL